MLQLLELLKDLMPPSHITLVGAGNGKGCLVQWLSGQSTPVTLVEAEEQLFETLQRVQAAGNFSQARLLHAVVAAEAEEVSFHTSSLAAENGLLPSEAVRQLWPNVQLLQVQQRLATSLPELLPSEHANQWLLLDCLPAVALVQGAASVLPLVDVILARVLLHTKNKIYQIPGCGLAELAEFLPEFSQVALQSTLHPDIAYALLVRDYRNATTRASNALAVEREAREAAVQVQQVLHTELEQTQYLNAGLLQKQELQAQSLQALEDELIKIKKMYAAEGRAKHAAIQEQKALQAQLQQVQHDNADLLQTQELQVQSLQALEADLIKIKQAWALEDKGKQEAIQVQEALQTQLQRVQHDNADLVHTKELQADSIQALEADLKKTKQAYIAEDKAKQAAIQAQAMLHAQLEQARNDNADFLQKQELQKQLQQALEFDFARTVHACDAEVQAKKTLQAQLEVLRTEMQDSLQNQSRLNKELYRAEEHLKLLEELLSPDAQQKLDLVRGPSIDNSHNAES